MSDSRRRRNIKIPRGKKSDRKKKKIESRNRPEINQMVGFTEFRKEISQEREKLIRGEVSITDKRLLHEPSPFFYDRTNQLRSNKRTGDGKAILLRNPEFKEGIDISTVKEERDRVIKGNRSKVFRELQKQYQDNQNNLKQDQRKSPTKALENARRQEEKNKRMAFEETEKKRVARDLEKQQEAKRLEVLEQERLESERIARIELEKQQEVQRLDALEQERLESERIARIELEKQQEVKRLEALEQERLESERIARIELEKQQEVELTELIVSDKKPQDSSLSSKQKRSF